MRPSKESGWGSDNDASSELEPQEGGSPRSGERPVQRTWAGFSWKLVLSLLLLLGLIVAAVGLSLLGFVFVARSFAPPVAQLAKDLYFDYSEKTAVASVSFLEDSLLKGSPQVKDGLLRIFPPAQQMDIWLELQAAEARGGVNSDVFQVVAQLLSEDGKSAATASRPCLVPQHWVLLRWLRNLFAMPLVVAGWWPENEVVKVPLFMRYVEQPGKPFTEFRAVLKAVGKSGNLPHLYGAKVHVDLIMGYFTSLLYWLRPGWSLIPTISAALALIGAGSLAAIIAFLFLTSPGPKSHVPPHSPPRSEDDADSEGGGPGSNRGSFELVEASTPRARPLALSSNPTAEAKSPTPLEVLLEEDLNSPRGPQRRRPQRALEAG